MGSSSVSLPAKTITRPFEEACVQQMLFAKNLACVVDLTLPTGLRATCN